MAKHLIDFVLMYFLMKITTIILEKLDFLFFIDLLIIDKK